MLTFIIVVALILCVGGLTYDAEKAQRKQNDRIQSLEKKVARLQGN